MSLPHHAYYVSLFSRANSRYFKEFDTLWGFQVESLRTISVRMSAAPVTISLEDLKTSKHGASQSLG